jgi:hypothetical protein
MKKITIELTEEQHTQMMNHLQRESRKYGQRDLFAMASTLNVSKADSWFEVEMNGMLNLGEVNWKIESTN